MKTLVLSSTDLEACLDLDELRNCMRGALISVSMQQTKNFMRSVVNLNPNAALGFMPAMEHSRNILGYKAVSVFHENKKFALNPHQGIVALLDSQTGLVKCLIEGSTLTALRTAAVSGVATEHLSRAESNTMAIIGVGRQALEHIRAITRIRTIKKIFLFNRSADPARKFADLIQSKYGIDVLIKSSAKAAVLEADIVITCTSSPEPLIDVNDFRHGTHVNAIGACRPGFREIQLATHPFLKIYLDSKEACAHEAEEINQPMQAGILSPTHIIGELGCCLVNKINSRLNSSEITLFKSVGLSIEDVLAADYFYNKALKQNKGQVVQL